MGSKKIGANKNSYLKRLGRVFLYYLMVCWYIGIGMEVNQNPYKSGF